jgi:FkbM family methyltransferase
MSTTAERERRVIYDIGANNGDDIPYYLKKADLVVAVEADPILCERMQTRFAAEIDRGTLIVENCVLTAEDLGASVPFYICTEDNVKSQFPVPKYNLETYEQILLPAKTIDRLIEAYGTPYYIKIDIENYDHILLKSLFDKGIRSEYISAESHRIEVFCLLACLGKYDSFKLVDGYSVKDTYRDWSVNTQSGTEKFSFPLHSAGPFGEDVAGEWLDAAAMFQCLLVEGMGWKDIHAKRQNHQPAPSIDLFSTIEYLYYHLRWVATKRYANRVIGKISRTLQLSA